MSRPDFPPTAENNQHIVADLKDFSTFKEMRASAAYRKHQRALKRLFNKPRIYRSAGVEPRLQAFVRVVVWNIERGSRLAGIIEALNHHPVLQYADLLLLNELDDGMARAENVNVPLELSRALSAHAVFGVEYLELTKGTGDELNLPSENTAALHGNAILTRHEFSSPEIVRLPRCENNFESKEKRIGGRLGLFANIKFGDKEFLAATAHLDVVNTPRCRAQQLRQVLSDVDRRLVVATTAVDQDGVTSAPFVPSVRVSADTEEFVLEAKVIRHWEKPSHPKGAVILGGDFNTHTFARGGRLRTMWNTIRILGGNPARLAHSLMRKEPAVKELERFGYEVDDLNDRLPTSSSLVSGLDDKSSLPPPVRWWVNRRVGPQGIRLDFRLDWLAARGVRVLREGEMTDAATGVKSIKAQTIKNLFDDGMPLSDHDPIVADITFD